MIRKIYIISFLACSVFTYAQQIEFGPDIGYWSTNIRYKPRDFNERLDIGTNLPSLNYGFSAFYSFKKAKKRGFSRLGLLYRHHNRGSVSHQDRSSKFAYVSDIIGVLAGIGTGLGNGFSFLFDLGLGYNFIKNKSPYYFSDKSQVEAFFDLTQDLDIKSKEWLFLYQLGIEKPILKNKVNVFVNLIGDIGITSINNGGIDDYFSYSFGFGAGARYIINYIPNASYAISEDLLYEDVEYNPDTQSPRNNYHIPQEYNYRPPPQNPSPTRRSTPPRRLVPRATPPVSSPSTTNPPM